MPKYYAPRKTSGHRIAAIALYKALLSQCLLVPFQIEKRSAFENVIRTVFRKNVLLQGSAHIQKAFAAGYEALDHLDRASASEDVSILTEALARLPASLTSPPPLPARTADTRQVDETPKTPSQPLRKILDRPLPLSALNGERKVPILASANRMPILRIQKPQPAALSHYLNSRVKQRQKRHMRLQSYEELVVMANWEDQWDQLVSQLGAETEVTNMTQDDMREKVKNVDSATPGKELFKPMTIGSNTSNDRTRGEQANDSNEPQWIELAFDAVQEVRNALDRERESNIRFAARMTEIVDREKELAEKERKDRVMRKNAEKRARKAASLNDGGGVVKEDI